MEENKHLFWMVKTLEIVFSEKRAILRFSAARHTLTEVNPEVIASAFVPSYSPSRRHLPILGKFLDQQFLKLEIQSKIRLR